MLRERTLHQGHGGDTRKRAAAVAGDDVHSTLVRIETRTLQVWPVSFGIAVAVVQDNSLHRGWRPVGPVNQHGTLIDVGVTGEYQIHSGSFQQRQEDFAN